MRRSLSRWSLTFAGVVAAILCAASLGGGVASAHGQAVLCVNPHGNGCYQSIQAAVDHAPPGARINVAAGTYSEQVTITKSLTLHGAGSNSVVNATGQSHGFFVDGIGARGTVISGFTVKNATLEGILIRNTKQVVVSGNVVSHNDGGRQPDGTCPGALPFDQDDCGEAIHLLGVAWSTISHNVVANNVGGILLTDETGPTHDNLITHNVVRDNKLDCGITLPSHPSGFDANGNAAPITGMTIKFNTVTNEAIDVWVGSTAMNLALHDNNLLGKSAIGVQNAGGGTVDATQNYWGCPGGPGAAGCSTVQGTVTFVPFLKHPV